jgi:hypothetical protein
VYYFTYKPIVAIQHWFNHLGVFAMWHYVLVLLCYIDICASWYWYFDMNVFRTVGLTFMFEFVCIHALVSVLLTKTECVNI